MDFTHVLIVMHGTMFSSAYIVYLVLCALCDLQYFKTEIRIVKEMRFAHWIADFSASTP